jgi:diaminopimelate epimerase
MKNLHFYKIHAGGNDFICIDNLSGKLNDFITSPSFSEFLIKICQRGLGVGGDGLIIAEQATDSLADIQARFFEPDGSEVELCGNGTACFVYWVFHKKLVSHQEIAIQTRAGINNGRLKEDGFCSVCVPDPSRFKQDICIVIDNTILYSDFIQTGTGHAVGFVENVSRVDVANTGAHIRHHASYGQTVNANFTEILCEGHIKVRTFEFGVEAETLACGTGSASAAMLTAVRYQWDYDYLHGIKPVLVDVKGGETLKIWFNYDSKQNRFFDVCLETIPKPVYEGITTS